MSNSKTTTPAVKKKEFLSLLSQARASIERSIPKSSGLTADRVMQTISAEIKNKPKLLDCSVESLGGAVMLAARLGLEMDQQLGQMYLIPFANTLQVIVGYRGMLELAMRSAEVKSIYAQEVYETDTFEVLLGTEKVLRHIPSLRSDRGDLRAVYAVTTYTNGSQEVEVMSKSEVDAVKGRSKASGSGPWKTDYGSMARKSVIRRMCKYIPRAVDAQIAAGVDEAFGRDAGDLSSYIEGTAFEAVETPAQTEQNTVNDLKETLQG